MECQMNIAYNNCDGGFSEKERKKMLVLYEPFSPKVRWWTQKNTLFLSEKYQ